MEEAGQKAVLMAGDVQDPKDCRAIIDKAVSELGGIDILINNAAHQATFKEIEDISDEEWDLTFRVNIHAMFYLTKAAVPVDWLGARRRHGRCGYSGRHCCVADCVALRRLGASAGSPLGGVLERAVRPEEMHLPGFGFLEPTGRPKQR